MRYYFAPMEGITTALYRNLHHRFFPGMDQYYTPFLSPARDHVFSKRDLQEILPEHQEGVPVVPQLLTKYPEDFIWAAGELAAPGDAQSTPKSGTGCTAPEAWEKNPRWKSPAWF